LLDRKPRALSGGQRQRVAMGRAIVRDPNVFLFDEPLSNLDAKLRVQMRSEIKELHQRLGTTTIYVTHDQVEAMTLADRVVVMNGGVVEQEGPPLELYDRPKTLFVAAFIGSPPMNFWRARSWIEPCSTQRRDTTAVFLRRTNRRVAASSRGQARALHACFRRMASDRLGRRTDGLGDQITARLAGHSFEF